MTVDLDAELFWRDGFLLVRNVFSRSEVAHFRERVDQVEDVEADLLTDTALGTVILDERIQEIARRILDAQPVYFGDSSVSLGPTEPSFHKDNTDRSDKTAPDWQTDRYPIIRFGIYLQDHDKEPGGLDLLRGSHRFIGQNEGEFYSATTRMGDVVIWTLRTSHSANSQLFRFTNWRLTTKSPFWRFRHYLVNKPFNILMRPPHTKRMALFFTLGAESSYLERYISYLKTRDYARAIWAKSSMSGPVLKMAAQVGLKVIPPEELAAAV